MNAELCFSSSLVKWDMLATCHIHPWCTKYTSTLPCGRIGHTDLRNVIFFFLPQGQYSYSEHLRDACKLLDGHKKQILRPTGKASPIMQKLWREKINFNLAFVFTRSLSTSLKFTYSMIHWIFMVAIFIVQTIIIARADAIPI